jgi:transcription initiation factor TFIIIB Brf1 subunit/transcription initiation factor TFIIB
MQRKTPPTLEEIVHLLKIKEEDVCNAYRVGSRLLGTAHETSGTNIR